jgi:MFS family permease
MPGGAAPAGPTRAWPPAARGWLAVALLALASIMSQFDRTVINLMVGPVKAAFSLDDTHFGMLQGIAFGIFYVLACIPIGRLADRYSRSVIIGVAIGFWSLFAMGSGLARTYLQLFLTRIGVAVGEASLTPAGFSMLADLFPPERLGKPVGAYLMSSPVGQGFAFMGGGLLLQWLSTSSLLASGPLATFSPWQAAFLIVGFPGLLLVPAFLLFRDPQRRGEDGAAAPLPLPLAEVVAVVRSRAVALALMFAGFAMVPVVSYAFGIWTPALFQRVYGWNPAQVGVGFGLIQLIFGTGGAYFGGWLSDRIAQRGQLDAPLKVAAFGFVGCGLFGALAPLMPSAPLALTLLAPAIFLSNIPYACAGTALQLLIPNRARAQVSAMYITMTTLIGLGVGPMIVGLMTDHLFPEPTGIRYSMAIVVGVAAPVLMVFLLAASRPYRALRAAA